MKKYSDVNNILWLYDRSYPSSISHCDKVVLKEEAIYVLSQDISRLCLLLLNEKQERIFRMYFGQLLKTSEIAEFFSYNEEITQDLVKYYVKRIKELLMGTIFIDGSFYLSSYQMAKVLSVKNPVMNIEWEEMQKSFPEYFIAIKKEFLRGEDEERCAKYYEKDGEFHFVRIDYVEGVKRNLRNLDISASEFFKKKKLKNFVLIKSEQARRRKRKLEDSIPLGVRYYLKNPGYKSMLKDDLIRITEGKKPNFQEVLDLSPDELKRLLEFIGL